MKVRTRMAPSPTGDMHVGSMATLLKNYAFAKKHGGQFVLRIEDTDKVREVEGGVQAIQDIIRDYGLDWDEGPGKEGPYGPYVQSQRIDLYKKYVEELIQKEKAYYCFCSKERLEKVREERRAQKLPPKYDRHCRNISLDQAQERIQSGEEYVVRLKVPDDHEIRFTDLLRGDINFNSSEVDDQVILKSDGYPTYHLAVVVDDHSMDITHIMRGEEWISSTPKHVLLYEAFGWEKPVFAHIPVFLNPDGKGKMSKRKGTVSARSFLQKGYLPEALLNFFMILGWARKDGREVMTLEEYIQEFDPQDVSAKSVVFDLKKLDWMNGVYIRKLSSDELEAKLQPFLPADFPQEKMKSIVPLVFERLVVLSDIERLTHFFYRDIHHDLTLLLKKATPELVEAQLMYLHEHLQKLEEWDIASIEEIIRNSQAEHDWHRGQYFMMVRLAVTGEKASPPLFETIQVLGKERTLQRLQQATALLEQES